MKKKDDLFELVMSLSRSEKRYFRMSTTMQQGDKRYLVLFDALLKQKEYDEAGILKKLGRGMTGNQYNFLKNYLYNTILNSLYQLHSKSGMGQIKSQLQKINILYNKGLYVQGNKALKKVKKTVLEADDYLSLIEIIRLQKSFMKKEQDQSDFIEKSQRLHEEENRSLILLNQIEESNHLFSNVQFLYDSYGHPRSEKELKVFQKIFQNKLFTVLEKGEYLPFKAKVKLLLARIVFHMCRYDHEQHHIYARQLLFLYRENKEKMIQNPENYLSSLSYYLKSCSFLYKKEDFQTTLLELKGFEDLLPPNKKNTSLSANIFYTTYYNELFFYLQNCYIKECLDILEPVKEGLNIYSDQLNNNEKLYLNYLMALVYFGLGRFEESLNWFNFILGNFKQESTPHVSLRIRLMLLINHYELGNTRLLEPMVISTYRYLLNKRKMYQYESAVIRFIRKLPSTNTSAHLQKMFHQLFFELVEIIKDPYEYAGCAWFVFWLEGKECGVNLEEVFKQKALEKIKSRV